MDIVAHNHPAVQPFISKGFKTVDDIRKLPCDNLNLILYRLGKDVNDYALKCGQNTINVISDHAYNLYRAIHPSRSMPIQSNINIYHVSCTRIVAYFLYNMPIGMDIDSIVYHISKHTNVYEELRGCLAYDADIRKYLKYRDKETFINVLTRLPVSEYEKELERISSEVVDHGKVGLLYTRSNFASALFILSEMILDLGYDIAFVVNPFSYKRKFMVFKSDKLSFTLVYPEIHRLKIELNLKAIVPLGGSNAIWMLSSTYTPEKEHIERFISVLSNFL